MVHVVRKRKATKRTFLPPTTHHINRCASMLVAFLFVAIRLCLRHNTMSYDNVINRETTSVTLPTTTSKITTIETHASYFPRWRSGNGIPLQPIATYVQELLKERQDLYKHSTMFPEAPYMVDENGITSSNEIVWSRCKKIQRDDRWHPTHRLFTKAWRVLAEEEQRRQHTGRWSTLRNVVFHQGGFPFVVWYGDNRKCNVDNWRLHGTNETVSLPIFTTCALAANAQCDFAFPFPTYKLFRDARNTTEQWHNYSAAQLPEYAWESKLRQVVWRGSLYWYDYQRTVTSTRYKLLRRVTERKRVQGENNTLFDVQAMRVWNDEVNVTDLGGLTYACDFREFQRFVAVLDLDGLSWSSRFGSLLCHNSVVLKVEPEFVDYFHYDIQPWKHFIPVRSDLSDLDEIAAYVADPRNDNSIREIIREANAFCHERMLENKLAEDMLDIWSFYVDKLYQNDPNWMDNWMQVKSGLDKMDLLL